MKESLKTFWDIEVSEAENGIRKCVHDDNRAKKGTNEQKILRTLKKAFQKYLTNMMKINLSL